MNMDTQIDCAYQKMIKKKKHPADVGKFCLSAACVIIAI